MIEWIVTSCVLIATVTALRFLLRNRISGRLRYGLWLMVLLRLLVPLSLPSSLSVMNFLPDTQPVQRPAESQIATVPETAVKESLPAASKPVQITPSPMRPQQVIQVPQQATPEPTQTPQVIPQSSLNQQPSPQATRPAVTAKQIFVILWIGGMAVVGFGLLFCNFRFAYLLRKNRTPLAYPDIRLPVYSSPSVNTPCLCGFFRPAIYLPSSMEHSAVQYALTHELSHYQHGDHIWSALRCLCLALHWYNPLVWIAATLSKQDAELACDEAVIRQLGEEHRTDYGKALIQMAAFRHSRSGLLSASTTMLTTKHSLKERIMMISKKQKTAITAFVCVLFVTAVAVGCTFTGKKTPQEQPQQSQPQAASALPFENGEVVFIRQKGGFGSNFTITLYEDGTFKYYEGTFSSYFGHGNWQLDDNLLTLTETKFRNSFLLKENTLIWLEKESTGFTYGALMLLADCDRFVLQDALPAQLSYLPELSYLPQDYLDGGPMGSFVHVDGTTYVWDLNVVDKLDGLSAEKIGTVAVCDNTVIPSAHLASCRIPAGTELYKGTDAGHTKYEAIYYKLEDLLHYARLLPVDAYRGNERWWESQTIHDGSEELTKDALRKLQEEKGKLLSRGDLTQYGYVRFAGCPYQDYRLFQVDSNYRLLLISPATVADTEAMQARFYHKDSPLYWIDLITTDIDLYQSSIYIDDPAEPNSTEIVYDIEGTVTAESLKSGVPCRIQLEKHYDGNRHLETQLIITSASGTIREVITSARDE